MQQGRVIFDADAKHTRKCGSCTLCCKMLPVRELDKGANERCKFQRHTGCTVYHKEGMPLSCYYWNCRWLTGEDTHDLHRPDRSHYVIDAVPDYIAIVDNATGESHNLEVVQIWCDPAHRDAHRDPVLRAYLYRRAEEGIAALVRFSASEALNIMAPPLCQDRQWHEVKGGNIRPGSTSLLDTMKALNQTARVKVQL